MSKQYVRDLLNKQIMTRWVIELGRRTIHFYCAYEVVLMVTYSSTLFWVILLDKVNGSDLLIHYI